MQTSNNVDMLTKFTSVGDPLKQPGFRLIVTGGRDYQDRNATFWAITRVHAEKVITLIIHGACCRPGRPTELCGADRWAQEWAQENEIPYLGVPAAWKKYGRPAGPKRNKVMALMDVNGVLALPGRDGTANMIEAAEEAGIQVWRPFG